MIERSICGGFAGSSMIVLEEDEGQLTWQIGSSDTAQHLQQTPASKGLDRTSTACITSVIVNHLLFDCPSRSVATIETRFVPSCGR